VAVRVALDLLTLAYRPGDSALRASYLAGLLVGLSDRELCQVKCALEDADGNNLDLGRTYAPEEIRQGSGPEELLPAVEEAYQRERDVRRRVEQEPVSSVLEWMVDDTGLMAHAALDNHGDLEAGSLLRLQHEAQALESRGNRGWEVAKALRERRGR
jgi:hypothetical protein